MSTLLIIVTGAPAAGKTTVARHIADAFRLPFYHKDGIKETLFDTLGWSDREWSKTLGAASMAMLYDLLGIQLTAGRPCVVESNFYPEFATSNFLALKKKFRFKPLQIVCLANPQVLSERWHKRVCSQERHPGHVNHVLADEFGFAELRDKFRALEIGGRVLQVDTTDMKTIDYAELFQVVASELKADA